jgi:RNA polymerase sigma-70 factor, ECF subfamily
VADFTDDAVLVKALAARDPDAFAYLLDRYHPSLVRLAQQYVPSRAVAEEVAQETWLAVIEGIDRFEQRSSIKTWLFRILINIARSRGVQERRSIPFATTPTLDDEPAVDPTKIPTPRQEHARPMETATASVGKPRTTRTRRRNARNDPSGRRSTPTGPTRGHHHA